MKYSKGWQMFFLMFLNYFLIVANIRAFTQGHYWWTVLTDLVYAAANFRIVKLVAAAETKTEQVFYVLGGTVGSVASIFVTKMVFGS